MLIINEWSHNSYLFFSIFVFSVPFYSSRSLQMSHTGPLIRWLRTCPSVSSAPSISCWMNVSTTCGRSGDKVYFSGTFFHSSVHTQEMLIVAPYVLYSLASCTTRCISLCLRGVFGTCREARFLSSLLWSHQRQLSVNPPLHRSDHVALGVLQQFVQLRRRRWFSQNVNRQESNPATITTWKVFTSTSEAPGGGWRDWRPEIKTS